MSESTDSLTFDDSLIDQLNCWQRRNREIWYELVKDNGNFKERIVSEGDSWFQHPTAVDLIDVLSRHKQYRIRSLGAAGDTLAQMVEQDEFVDAIRQEAPSIFLLSGGGNDLVEKLPCLLNQWDGSVEAVVNRHELQEFTEVLRQQIVHIYNRVQAVAREQNRRIPMIFHGYDQGDPGNPYLLIIYWGLEDALRCANVPCDKYHDVMRLLIQLLNKGLSVLSNQYEHLYFLNLQGKVEEWIDELHPDLKGAFDLAEEFHQKIRSILRPSRL